MDLPVRLPFFVVWNMERLRGHTRNGYNFVPMNDDIASFAINFDANLETLDADWPDSPEMELLTKEILVNPWDTVQKTRRTMGGIMSGILLMTISCPRSFTVTTWSSLGNMAEKMGASKT